MLPLPPTAVFWWPAAAVGANHVAHNTVLAALFSVLRPEISEFIQVNDWTAHDVVSRGVHSPMLVFALGAEDGLTAIQSFQLLQELARMAQADPNVKEALRARRVALVFSSARSAQPNITLENQLVPLLKKCGMIYLGAYWHYAGAHPGWLLQNGPKAGSFRHRLESEYQLIEQHAAHFAANQPHAG